MYENDVTMNTADIKSSVSSAMWVVFVIGALFCLAKNWTFGLMLVGFSVVVLVLLFVSGRKISGEYNLAGVNFRGLDEEDTGDFEGVIRREPNNKYDRNAVAVYVGEKKVGYIPRAKNAPVARFLERKGGEWPCTGYIATGYDEDREENFFYGSVFIE